MTIARGDSVALARELVRIDSRNPRLVPGAPGEVAVAAVLAAVLSAWGLDTQVVDAAPGRPNVIARRRGRGTGRSLMLNGHIDVVGVEGMSHAPFDAILENGRLYGRGASDMKGGVAAMCAAAARVSADLEGDIIIVAAADEEWESAGTAAALAAGARADAAIVAEPTGLRIMPAHKGFAWLEILVRGRAAHGSRWDIGIDAIRMAGLLLAELDRLDVEVLPDRTHRILGRPSVHASLIDGGIGLSTYPDKCVLRIERRTIPGETADDVLREVRDLCIRVQKRRPELNADVRLLFSQPPSDVSDDAPVVRALARELERQNLPTPSIGMSAWTDAALLNQAGIPAICFGPGDMALAHAAEEYIETRDIERATDVLTALATTWCTA